MKTSSNSLSFNRIYKGDARILSTRLPNRSIAVTLTSPPYWALKNYGIKEQIGWGQDYEEYLNDLVSIFRNIYRATRNNGSLWLILDTFKIKGRLKLLPFELSERLQEAVGWKLQDVIIWDKGKTLPWSHTGRLRNQFEYVLCFSKRKQFKYEIDRLKEIQLKEWWVKYPERYNPKGKVPANIWKLPIPVQGSWSSNGLRHACPFPMSLVERILLLTSDKKRADIVFDPFAGSGIVLAMAQQMGRGYLGFELNPEFIKMYRSVVKPFVKKEWVFRCKELKTLEGKRKARQTQILKLRLTKYPLTLIKQLTESSSPRKRVNLCSILAVVPNNPPTITVQPKRHHLLSLKVFLVTETVEEKQLLEQKIPKIASRPPLSKFGINAEIFAFTAQEIGSLQPDFGLPDDTVLWLYKNGVVHKYSSRTTMCRWIKRIVLPRHSSNGRTQFPVIASNVSVSQQIPRTWYPKSSDSRTPEFELSNIHR